MQLLLVRHARFVGNDVTHDTPDGPLTEMGRWQAERLAEYLQRFDITRIVAGPLMRTLETATAIAQVRGTRFAVWKYLYEHRQVGRYVGPSLAGLRRAYPLADFSDELEPDGWVCEGVEDWEQVRERGERIAVRFQREFLPEDVVAVVSHGGFNNVLLGALLGIPDPRAVRIAQGNACINHLSFEEDSIRVRCLNYTAHLETHHSIAVAT